MDKSLLYSLSQKLITASLLLSSNTSKNLAGYMSLTYSITGLLVILGLAGKHAMAAEVAIVQGAALATFYVFSGDARHLILTDKTNASDIVFFRLVCAIPLSILAFFLSTIAGHVSAILAISLILRKCAEWLAEPHVTEKERNNEEWLGWFIQPIFFLMLICQITFTSQLWFIWIWAVSPLLFSVNFILQAKPCSIFKARWENITSTAVIGFTGYIQRVLVVGLVGKEFSGMLFPGFALGSFVGTMAANVAGPTLLRKGLLFSEHLKVGIVVLLLIGISVFLLSYTIINKTFGLSIIGGAFMVVAQQSRLILLKENNTLSLDLLFQLSLVLLVPAIYYIAGTQGMMGFYLVGSIIAWLFYKGNQLALEITQKWKTRICVLVVLGLIMPVFFQLSGQLYNNELVTMADSDVGLINVPLPISIVISYVGILFFNTTYQNSKSVVMTISLMFLLLITSAITVSQGVDKLMLLIQYMLPTVALLLGIALTDFNQKLVAKTILYFLIFFIPLQLIITWLQDQLALTHYLYLFSVYAHQYIPLLMVGLFAWAWVELRNTHIKCIYFLAPWMGLYVAAANSILALLGLILFSGAFGVFSSKHKLNLLIPILILVFIGGYFYFSSQKSREMYAGSHYNLVCNDSFYDEVNKICKQGIFLNKLFDKKGDLLLLQNTQNTSIPTNVHEKTKLTSLYVGGIFENPASLLMGHPLPLGTIASSTHSYYLDLTYDFGIFACAPLLFLIAYTSLKSYQKKSEDKSLLWLLAIILYFLLIDNNLKVTLRQPYPAIVVLFLWGVLLRKLGNQKAI